MSLAVPPPNADVGECERPLARSVAPPPAAAAEQVELRGLTRGHQIVCCHADQTERTRILERVEKGGGVCVKLLGDVGWFLAQVLTGQGLKVGRF